MGASPMDPLFRTRYVNAYWAGHGFTRPGLHLWVAPLRRHVRVLPVRRSWLP